jgi:endonuclease/exonuclease/phosphatase family metal-dependent hydrolase
VQQRINSTVWAIVTIVLAGVAFWLTSREAASPKLATAMPGVEFSVCSWNIGYEPLNDRVDEIADQIIELTPVSSGKLLAEELTNRGLPMKFVEGEMRERQSIGMLVSSAIHVVNVELVPGSNLRSNGLRYAMACQIQSGKFDGWVIALHNKSKRDDTDGRTREMRQRQLRAVLDFTDSASKEGEKDYILVGDFNADPRSDRSEFAFLRTHKYRLLSDEAKPNDFTQAGGSARRFLDNIVVSPGVSEYVESSFKVVRHDESYPGGFGRYRANVSDHLPVWAKFKSDADDDQ